MRPYRLLSEDDVRGSRFSGPSKRNLPVASRLFSSPRLCDPEATLSKSLEIKAPIMQDNAQVAARRL